MVSFWQKHIFWIVFLLLLAVSIPLSMYFFKPQILSGLAYISNRIKNQQAPKPGTCLILEEKYCSQAELVESIDAKGESGLVIGLKLPPGVPIRSPIDGEVSKAKTKYGYLGVINDPTDPTVLAIGIQGHIEFKNMFTVKAKKGDVIGYTQDWDEEQFLPSPLGNYTLGISSTRRQDGKIIDNPDKLRDLFPRAFKKQ